MARDPRNSPDDDVFQTDTTAPPEPTPPPNVASGFATDETIVPESGRLDSFATDETILPSERHAALVSGPSHPSGVQLTSQVGQELKQGDAVGEYVVDKMIGEGGFGRVFAGHHPVIGKAVAIKVLHVRYSADPDIVSRFIAEARAVNQIGHDGIIDIFAFGTLPDGRHYYVMELLEGSSLREHIAKKGRLSLDETVDILGQVAGALDAAHANGVTHRDFKPDNIFLSPKGDGWRAKLLDFGVAKLVDPDNDLNHKTATGASVGTPAYMAPEQVVGKDVDHRADIYAFGVVAFHMLTGQLPFAADSAFSIMTAHVNEPPPDPTTLVTSLPRGVDEALRWALAKAPADRPSTSMEFIERLAAIARGDDRPPPLPLPTMALSTGEGGRSKLPIVILAVILLAGVGAYFALGSGDDPPPPDPGAVAATGTDEANPPAAAPDPPPPAPDAAVPDAAKPDAAAPEPATVQIELTDLPEGAEVKNADGELLRSGSGPITVPRSGDPLELMLTAPGHVDRTMTVTPDRDRAASVSMEKKAAPRPRPIARPRPRPTPRPQPPTPSRNPGKDDLDPF